MCVNTLEVEATSQINIFLIHVILLAFQLLKQFNYRISFFFSDKDHLWSIANFSIILKNKKGTV